MSRKYFGTDGVRGTVGQAPMTAILIRTKAEIRGTATRKKIDVRPRNKPITIFHFPP